MGTISSLLRTGALALAIALGLLTAGPAIAQEATAQAAQAAQTTQEEEDDGGFDDWGLLGLLGLGGLAGLRRREPEVRRVDVDRVDRTNDPRV